jgi:hypothetical protein
VISAGISSSEPESSDEISTGVDSRRAVGLGFSGRKLAIYFEIERISCSSSLPAPSTTSGIEWGESRMKQQCG